MDREKERQWWWSLDDYIIIYCQQLQLNKIQTKAVFIFVCDFQLCLLRILVYKGRRDRMVVGFTTTYAINTYHYQRCEFESHSGDTTLCYKVCQWLATGRWFSQSTQVSSTNKTSRHDIAEILLNVALSTINQPNQPTIYFAYCHISDVMASVLASRATDRRFEARLCQLKTN
jgi:hypothetical protein